MCKHSNEFCVLCGSSEKLQDSHIIPKFVIKWFKDTSPTGYLRTGDNVDIRKQDGIKKRLLCIECEGKFNKYETLFANKIFFPFHNNNFKKIDYDEWLYKFIISISWRVLKNFEDEATIECISAMQTWSNYLHENIIDTTLDKYQHHIIFIDSINIFKNYEPKARNINEYLIRTIDAAILGNNTLVVYTKMSRIIILSTLNIPMDKFFNTKIVRGVGVLSANQTIEDYAFYELIESRAQTLKDISSQMSNNQKDKVLNDVKKNTDRLLNSEWYRAMKEDYK